MAGRQNTGASATQAMKEKLAAQQAAQQAAQAEGQDDANSDPQGSESDAELQAVYGAAEEVERELGGSDFQQAARSRRGRRQDADDDYDRPAPGRKPPQAELDERKATDVAFMLRREEDRFYAESREEMKRAARRGEPVRPRKNRVLSLITEAPDSSVPHYSNGQEVPKEKGYVYRWVRTISDFGNQESNARMLQFKAARYETVPDPSRNGEPVKGEFGILMRAKAEHAGIRMISKMKPGVRKREDNLRASLELAEAINKEAGQNVITVRQNPLRWRDYENPREREVVTGEYEVD